MKTINELQDEVIEEFSDFDDWMDKYQLLIDLGNEQEPLDPQYKTCLLYTSYNISSFPNRHVKGQQPELWFRAAYLPY